MANPPSASDPIAACFRTPDGNCLRDGVKRVDDAGPELTTRQQVEDYLATLDDTAASVPVESAPYDPPDGYWDNHTFVPIPEPASVPVDALRKLSAKMLAATANDMPPRYDNYADGIAHGVSAFANELTAILDQHAPSAKEK